MYWKNKRLEFKQAFTLVEMMMLLVIASLILAASIPVVTKKHLHLPTLASHGTYICYYQDGHLMEARKSGRVNQKMLAGYPRETTNCVFDPPPKVSLFQITAIGGGGGGGDAGYDGTLPSQVEYSSSQFSPLNITEGYLKEIGIKTDDVTEDGKRKAIEEVVAKMGKLWGLAEGASSGPAGTLYYMNIKLSSSTLPCLPDKIEEKPIYSWSYTNRAKPAYLCKGSDNLGHRIYHKNGGNNNYDGIEIQPNIKICRNNDGNGDIVGVITEYPATSATCYMDYEDTTCEWQDDQGNWTDTPQTYSCISYENCRAGLSGCQWIEPVYDELKDRTYNYTPEPEIIPCVNPCTYAEATNCDPGPCKSNPETQTLHCPLEGEPNYGTIEVCNTPHLISPGHWVPSSVAVNSTCIKECTNRTKQKTMDWIDSKTASREDQGIVSGDHITCSDYDQDNDTINEDKIPYQYISGYTHTCTMSNDERVTHKLSYEKKRYPASENERKPGGKGAFCRTAEVTGGLGISFDIPVRAPQDINSYETINERVNYAGSICQIDNSYCGPAKGEVSWITEGETPTFTQVKLTKKVEGNSNQTYIAKANSSKNPGESPTIRTASMACDSLDFWYRDIAGGEKMTFCEFHPEPYYYDELDKPAKAGQRGTCEDGISTTVGNSTYDCRGSNNTKATWCLKHANGTLEREGYYRYSKSQEHHTLPKGGSGYPGEFKTMVVRSMNGIDRTIKVGRGGSAAAFNLGNRGAEGSATSFGTLLTAAGGGGGLGKQEGVRGILPSYDKNVVRYKELYKCFVENKNQEEQYCKDWKERPEDIPFYKNTSGDVGSKPTQTTLGGMFSFVMSFKGAEDPTAEAVIEYAGRGGTGGGVEYFCWAGESILEFEGTPMKKSSSYRDNRTASELENVPSRYIIPKECYNDAYTYRNIPASPGYDGALIITW